MNAMTEPLLFKQTIEGQQREFVSFSTHPANYQHWTLSVDAEVARLKLDINEDGGIKPGYLRCRPPVSAAVWGRGLACRPTPRARPSQRPSPRLKRTSGCPMMRTSHSFTA